MRRSGTLMLFARYGTHCWPSTWERIPAHWMTGPHFADTAEWPKRIVNGAKRDLPIGKAWHLPWTQPHMVSDRDAATSVMGQERRKEPHHGRGAFCGGGPSE